jgi:hypothetical protein
MTVHISQKEVDALQKRCQIGVPGTGRNAMSIAHDILADCYGVIGALAAERNALLRGEFICQKCGLRKDSEHPRTHEF